MLAVGSTSTNLLQRLTGPADSEAWERFVELYTPLLYFWARRWRVPGDDAADLVQEVLTRLVVKLPDFRYSREKSFRGWLRTVMLNQWRELLRRRTFGMEHVGSRIQQFAQSNETIDDLTETEYRQIIAQEAIKVMERDFQPQTWMAFKAVVIDGLSAAEVASKLNLTEGAVRAAKFRVLSRLKLELAELWD